jgi:hypothetical protein
MTYSEFLKRKSQIDSNDGFDPVWMPDFLFDFQRSLVDWSIRKGRCAIFADCGLGKTPMQLVWAENVTRKTNGNVLILTPLAVAHQTVKEAHKFGIEATFSRDGKPAKGITVTNYEKLHLFDPDDYVGGVGDESSSIKAFDGKRRRYVTRFFSKMRYRSFYTATAAPNDYIELGTHSEALGVLNQSDMLSMFFRNLDNERHTLFKDGDFWNRAKWGFKPHAEERFWRWVCSWGRAIRKPSDLGFPDNGFILPRLNVSQTVVENPELFTGELFPRVAVTLAEQRDERRQTMKERCEAVASLVDHQRPAISWCHLNPEGDMLEEMIPGARQVKGAMPDEEKEEILQAFSDGQLRVIVTKPTIAGFGLNWQHCNHMTFFPSHSFEQYYQGVRRCWRFGQKSPVKVDIITTPGEAGVTANLQKKADAAEAMFKALIREMHNILTVQQVERHNAQMEMPTWL